MAEPTTIAVILVIFGALLGVSAILSRALGRLGVPVLLLFLVIGMLAGSDGLDLIYFADHEVAFRIGTIALALILFDGGLNTHMDAIRANGVPSIVLATVGVAATAILVALVAHMFGMGWFHALLLASIVSSTDAAAVFSVLRGTRLDLPRRIAETLELESGLNDPMAVILTLTITQSLVTGGTLGFGLVFQVILQLVVGAGFGIGIGYLGRIALRRTRPFTGGLFPVLTVSIAFVAFGVPTLLMGSGFLAVYLAGVVLNEGALPYRAGLIRVHDFLAWFSQVVLFVTLGLLVFPADLPQVIGIGLAISGVLALVARPLVVTVLLLPFRYSPRAIAYIGWVGLRGAVPVILAAFPVFAGVEGAQYIFNIVFLVVIVSALIQGTSLPWVTRWLKLEEKLPPPAPALLEITSTKLLKGEIVSFYIEPASAVCNASIADIPFPAEAAVMLIIRGDTLLAPKGNTQLLAGDHVYVFFRPEDSAFIHLIFGHEENPP